MALSFEKVTRIIARVLGQSPDGLVAAFRPAVEEDFLALCEFRRIYSANTQTWDDVAYLRWRYSFLPVAEGEHANRLWILRIHGNILGAIGVDCATMTDKGDQFLARNPLDLLVKQELDGLGLGVWMSMVLERHFSTLFALGATKYSKRILQEQFTPMPALGAWKTLITSQAFLQKLLPWPALAQPLGALVNAVIRSRIRWQVARCRRRVLCQPIENFLPYDAELAQMQQGYSAVITRRRTAAFLNWRFLQNPRRQYQAMGVFVQGKLCAYVVFHVNGTKHWHLDDLFGFADQPDALKAAIWFSLENAVAAGVNHLAFTAHAWYMAEVLTQCGLRWRDDEHLFGVYVQNTATQGDLLNGPSWWLTSCDTHSEGF